MVKKAIYIKDLVENLDELYPHELAWEEDLPRIGFILGNKENKLTNVLLTLDVNMAVVEEAICKKVNFIITHHPLIFKPIYKLDYCDNKTKTLLKLIENNIAVYAMHTNFDVAKDGVADELARKLNLKSLVGTNEKDSYLRMGEIDSIKLSDYLEIIKLNLNLSGLKYAGDLNKIINKVAIIGGSGGKMQDVLEALNLGADLYISSEFKLDVVQFAVENNLAIVEINHGVEKLALYNLLNLKQFLNHDIFVSDIETDPFKYY